MQFREAHRRTINLVVFPNKRRSGYVILLAGSIKCNKVNKGSARAQYRRRPHESVVDVWILQTISCLIRTPGVLCSSPAVDPAFDPCFGHSFITMSLLHPPLKAIYFAPKTSVWVGSLSK